MASIVQRVLQMRVRHSTQCQSWEQCRLPPLKRHAAAFEAACMHHAAVGQRGGRRRPGSAAGAALAASAAGWTRRRPGVGLNARHLSVLVHAQTLGACHLTGPPDSAPKCACTMCARRKVMRSDGAPGVLASSLMAMRSGRGARRSWPNTWARMAMRTWGSAAATTLSWRAGRPSSAATGRPACWRRTGRVCLICPYSVFENPVYFWMQSSSF